MDEQHFSLTWTPLTNATKMELLLLHNDQDQNLLKQNKVQSRVVCLIHGDEKSSSYLLLHLNPFSADVNFCRLLGRARSFLDN